MESEGEEARLAWLEELKAELGAMKGALVDLVEYLKRSSISSSSDLERSESRPVRGAGKEEKKEAESVALDIDALAERIAARLRIPEPEKPAEAKRPAKPLLVRRR